MSGFTLIELMMVIGIVAVLAVLALPAMGDMVVANRMKALSLDLYSSLALARSEAIKRNISTVSMIAAGGNWQNGWTVTCVDTANACGGGGNLVLMAGDAVDASIRLTEANGITMITFSRDGRLATAVSSLRVIYTANNSNVPLRCV